MTVTENTPHSWFVPRPLGSPQDGHSPIITTRVGLNVPVSHPFVERLIGTVRRELLDQTLFWNALDLKRKLDSLRHYYNANRDHSSLGGQTPAKASRNRERQRADI